MRRPPALDPAADGSHLRPEMTVLSDLSANVFAALLLILVVLLQVRALADRAARATSVQPPAVDAVRDLGAVAHRALRAADLVAMLKRRDPASPGLGLDLGEREVAITRDGATETLPAEAGLARIGVRRDGGGEPVRLYVFSNRHHGEAVARLGRAGSAWTELSVPRALRDPAAEGRWSPDFLALAARPTTLDEFRDGLARLLAASDSLAPGGHVAGRAGAPGGSSSPSGGPPAASLWDRLLRWLGLAVAALLLLAGAAVVGLTEWLVPRRAVGYGRGQVSSEGRRARRDPST